tara:strand:- start:162 stop:584 length:423 start_codon:yes stop_codon:yes gene_type:complete
MSFQEKSAYVMVVALLLGGGLYFYEVLSQSMGLDGWISPAIPGLLKLTLMLVIVSIIGHIIIAAISPKEAEAKLDERETQIFNRAGSLSGFILGFVVIVSLGNYLMSEDGSLLFYTIFAGLIVSQLAEYMSRIFLYRTAL